MDWSNLDSQFLCNLFGKLLIYSKTINILIFAKFPEYFSFEELKILSLVCRNWYEEIAFLWHDKLRLDFEHFFNNRRSLKSNTNILANGKRRYVDVKIENNAFFEDTAAVFKAISLRRGSKCKRLIKSLELKGFGILQIEDIFSWMGDSLEKLSISNMCEQNSFKLDRKTPSKMGEKYLKMLSNLSSLSLKKISKEFQEFFKYFINVTSLTLNCISLDQLKESLSSCSKVRTLRLGDIHGTTVDLSDLDVFKNLESLTDIVIESSYSEVFFNLLVKTICSKT